MLLVSLRQIFMCRKLRSISEGCMGSRSEKNIDFSKAFTSLSLFQTGPPQQQGVHLEPRCFSAKFQFDGSIAPLFPFLNAEIKGALYNGDPEYIKFLYKNRLCILYPQEGAFTSVENHGDAIDYLHLLEELLQDIQARQESILPNHRQITVVSPLDIYKILPGTNCKECGYNTCLAFAAALSRQYTSHIKCPYLLSPVEETSTFRVIDKDGHHMKNISLAIDTGDLYQEIKEKQQVIDELQVQLATFEKDRENSLEKNNAKLLSPLTIREIEVLAKIGLGATNKEIAGELYISEHTVKTHISHIFDKLGVKDRAQASVWAVKNGLL